MKAPTLRKQLRDPVYKAWFAKPPLEVQTSRSTPPWVVYVQRKKGGPWGRARFSTWVQGYRFVAKNINHVHDMALCHTTQQFKPPVVRDTQTGKRRYHFPSVSRGRWCGFCRRMTVFTYFGKHHAMPSWADSGVRRCHICGARETLVRRFD